MTITIPISLNDEEYAALTAIATQTNRTPEQLIHDLLQHSITHYYATRPAAVAAQPPPNEPIQAAAQQTADELRLARRREAFAQARGIWRDRTDLPDLDELRGRYPQTRMESR